MRPPISSINVTLAFSTAVAALGGMLFGFDTAVIAGTTRSLTAVFHLTPATLGITVSCAIWGTMAGSLSVGPLAARFGAPWTLRLVGVLYVFSALGCALAPAWPVFLVARFLGGLAIGGCSVASPMYIAETSPPTLRGRLVACFQLCIVSGILIAYLSNQLLGRWHPGPGLWRLQLGAAALPAAAFLVALFFIPESPLFLLKHNRAPEAAAVLARMGVPQPDVEVRRLAESLHADAHRTAQASLLDTQFRRPLLLGLALGLFNQFSGINAVLYYLNDIFALGGIHALSPGLQAVAVGVANLVFTLVGMSLIDRAGRKPLLVWGAVGMTVALAGIARIFWTGRLTVLLLPLLLCFVACFAGSQGAVLWVYLSELFPAAIRERGQSVASFWLWLLTAVVSGIFPSMAAISHSFPFALFAACMAVQVVVVQRFFPETRGLLLEGVT